jgi:hypothetical protein
MPLVAALVIFDVMFVWHAVKTGRACPWAYVILAIPGFGAVAYLALEIVPEWLNSIEGQKAQAKLGNAIDPEKRYRLLTDNLMVSDTVSNRVALAEECLALQKFDQADADQGFVLQKENASTLKDAFPCHTHLGYTVPFR